MTPVYNEGGYSEYSAVGTPNYMNNFSPANNISSPYYFGSPGGIGSPN
jgi:hypothetical protein